METFLFNRVRDARFMYSGDETLLDFNRPLMMLAEHLFLTGQKDQLLNLVSFTLSFEARHFEKSYLRAQMLCNMLSTIGLTPEQLELVGDSRVPVCLEEELRRCIQAFFHRYHFLSKSSDDYLRYLAAYQVLNNFSRLFAVLPFSSRLSDETKNLCITLLSYAQQAEDEVKSEE